MALIPSVVTVTSTGPVIVNPTGSFNRPADTTPYASGDLVANSTTAGSVAPVNIVVSRADAGSFIIDRVKIRKTSTSTANASFRVHLFSALPVSASGDNAVLSTTGSAAYLGSMDVVVDQAFTDGATGFSTATPKTMAVRLDTGYSVYALIEARAAYTPVSAETFTITLFSAQG